MATSVDAKLLRQTKFPPEFNQKVDMKKVNVEVMKKQAIRPLLWIFALTWRLQVDSWQDLGDSG
jgi:hypothetical protein